MAECAVGGCGRPPKSRGWCQAHYMRWWISGEEPTGPVTTNRRTPEPCEVDGCVRDARIGTMCSAHARRARRAGGDPGPPDIEAKRGNGQGLERGRTTQGYVFVKANGHPNGYSNGRILEHVLVMSKILGRPLIKGENVHHKNGDRADNRPANLELWSTHQPKGSRVADKVAWAREILDLYGDLPPQLLR